MSVITKSGKYRSHTGDSADVVYTDGKCAFGYLRHAVCCWLADDGVAAFRGGDFNIVGPWCETPDPGEGWRLLKDDEVIREGDEFFETNTTHNRWNKLSTSIWHGRDVGGRKRDFSRAGLHFRRRIEKPFTISEHGCGVYRTRDGMEVSIYKKTNNDTHCWEGSCGLWDKEWWADDGRYNAFVTATADDKHHDLVRYLRPLDKPHHEWKPTCELRWVPVEDKAWSTSELKVYTALPRLEQKWVCGDKFEWRAIGVQQ